MTTGLRERKKAKTRAAIREHAMRLFEEQGYAQTTVDQIADAAEVSLPVYTPATTEAFATYGVIDEGAAAQAVKAPEGVFKEFGGLEVQTSSTQLQELTDAFIYVYQ